MYSHVCTCMQCVFLCVHMYAVCVLVYVHAWVCVCARVFTHTHDQVRVNLGQCSLSAVHLIFWVRVSHCPKTSVQPQLDIQWVSLELGLQRCEVSCLAFLCVFWKVRVLHFDGRCFTNRVMSPPPLPWLIPVFQGEIAFIPKWENIKLKKWKPCTSSVLCRDWLGTGYMFDQCCSLRLEVRHREWVYRAFGTGCWGAGEFLACVRAERRKRDPGRLLGASALQRCFLGVCGMG